MSSTSAIDIGGATASSLSATPVLQKSKFPLFVCGGSKGAETIWVENAVRAKYAVKVVTFKGQIAGDMHHVLALKEGTAEDADEPIRPMIIDTPSELTLSRGAGDILFTSCAIKQPMPKDAYTLRMRQRDRYIASQVDALVVIGSLQKPVSEGDRCEEEESEEEEEFEPSAKRVAYSAAPGTKMQVAGTSAWICSLYVESRQRLQAPVHMWIYDMQSEEWFAWKDGNVWVKSHIPTVEKELRRFKRVGLAGSRKIYGDASEKMMKRVFR
jgi:hypothetical protein